GAEIDSPLPQHLASRLGRRRAFDGVESRRTNLSRDAQPTIAQDLAHQRLRHHAPAGVPRADEEHGLHPATFPSLLAWARRPYHGTFPRFHPSVPHSFPELHGNM